MLRRALPPLLWLAAMPALAHEGEPPEPHDLLASWSWDPGIVIPLLITGVLYAVGVARLWRGASTGRGIRRWETVCFALGWLALVVALVSPVHPIGEVLFAAHMVQHELLMLVAAPLLVLGRPLIPFLWALPISWRRALGRVGMLAPVRRSWSTLTSPLAAWTIHAAALWLWHIPTLFQAATRNELVHTLQHVSFLGSALLFCWAIVHGGEGRLGYGAAVLYVFTTAVHSSILGAFLTFSSTVWYPIYEHSTAAWGLTPLEDQQLGGLIMWVPAGVVYLAAALVFFASWLRASGPDEAAGSTAAESTLPESAMTGAAVTASLTPASAAPASNEP